MKKAASKKTASKKEAVEKPHRVVKAKAMMLLKPLGQTELLELFVVQRDDPEPPFAPTEIQLILGGESGQILITEEPVTIDSKRLIFEFYKRWLKDLESPQIKIHHLTDWVEPAEFETLTADYALPFEWKRLQGWLKKT